MRKSAKIISLVLALSVVMSFFSIAASENELILNTSAKYVKTKVSAPTVGSTGGEWAVVGLARSYTAIEQSYWDAYYEQVENYVKKCGGVLHTKKYTEYSRVALALTAIGADPCNVAGFDLLKPLGDFDKTVWQGVNGAIWALIALDSGNYPMPVNKDATVQATRQMYVDYIVSKQLSDGGWSLSDGSAAEPDITGMALQALAKYKTQSKVNDAIDRALECLKAIRSDDGGFAVYGTTTSESSAQVVVALCTLGIDPNGDEMRKNGVSVLDDFLSYRRSDGSFCHIKGGQANLLASEQGLYALAALNRFAKNENALYDMSDCKITVTGVKKNETGLPGKHDDVKKREIIRPDVTFDDISGHENAEAIRELAARGIINGRGDGTFDPGATMTRCEFASIIVGALGLEPKENNMFSDIESGKWYSGKVGTAASYGIVKGKGDGSYYDPLGTITRQEAAAMVARAARLCGMDTAMDEVQARNVLAQFGDYTSVADWAKNDVAFCYRENILDQNDLDTQPARNILRCEIAQMVYNLLGSAELL